MIRRLLVFALLAAIALPSLALKRATVSQVEQMLLELHSANKQDGEISRQIGGMELSERLSDATLDRLNKQFAVGSQTAVALQLLADQSVFLDLPATEVPSMSAPDSATQDKQLEKALKFAAETLSSLTDLTATRIAFSFDDSPPTVNGVETSERLRIHLAGTSKAELTVSAERKRESAGGSSAWLQEQGGLVAGGEFGLTLSTVLGDIAQGRTTWSHWERSATRLISVFDYAVPKPMSHQRILFPEERAQRNWRTTRWAVRTGMAPPSGFSPRVHTAKPGYHGSLWIDSATGTILRVALIVDLNEIPTLERSPILIEYGLVRINERTIVCPVRSLALSSSATLDIKAAFNGATTRWLNENVFADYHGPVSTSRSVGDNSPASGSSTNPTGKTNRP